MAITAGLEQNQAELIIFVSADYTGNARAKPRGKKVAPCNYLIIKIKHEVRDIYSRKVTGLFCQDFLQCVKPVRERIRGNKPEA
jgi:hypothetical protein